MTAATVLGVDVGGTTVKARLVSVDGRTLGEWRRPSPRGDASGTRTADTVFELLTEARRIMPVDAVGVVVPGVVDEHSGLCVQAVNLGWNDLAIGGILNARLGMTVAFGQDVRAGALAEITSGAAQDISGAVAFVPIGTGVACAIAVDGSLLTSDGWAGEIGQVIISCGSNAGRRIEEIASASGIARILGVADARVAAQLVRDGNSAAIGAWDDAVGLLAESLAWMTATVAPKVIVVGGGLAEAGSLLFDPLRAQLTARLPGLRSPQVVPAAHGEAAAIVGACELAMRLLGDETQE